MLTWTTEASAERERFDHWRDIVCKTMLDVATEARGDGFSARISGRSVGAIRFVSFDCTGHDIVRQRAHAENNSENCYVVASHLRGLSYCSQGSEMFSLRPHDIGIVDGRLPFRLSFKSSVSIVCAVIPHAMMHERAPWLRSRPHRKIRPSSEFADLARRHLRLLTASGASLADAQAMQLTENLCNLLAMAGRDTPPARMEPGLMRAAMFDYCQRHLHSMDLSPKIVAARFGVSVRTLHLRFAESGHSFGRWLLEQRLQAARKALGDPEQRSASISEIAYGAGFGDLSHFNRSFRARFDTSPGQWRATRDVSDQRRKRGGGPEGSVRAR